MEQITFSLNSQLSNNFNDFIESSSNRLAFQYIRDWPKNFGFSIFKSFDNKRSKIFRKKVFGKFMGKKTKALFLKEKS